jgi:hypothetical protein
MTPKEKAEELFVLYEGCYPENYDKTGKNFFTDNIKKCALIAVDEIINCLDDDDLYIQGETNIDGFISYYKEVKQEIEKL